MKSDKELWYAIAKGLSGMWILFTIGASAIWYFTGIAPWTRELFYQMLTACSIIGILAGLFMGTAASDRQEKPPETGP